MNIDFTQIKANYKLVKTGFFTVKNIELKPSNIFVEPTYDAEHINWFIEYLNNKKINHALYTNQKGRYLILTEGI